MKNRISGIIGLLLLAVLAVASHEAHPAFSASEHHHHGDLASACYETSHPDSVPCHASHCAHADPLLRTADLSGRELAPPTTKAAAPRLSADAPTPFLRPTVARNFTSPPAPSRLCRFLI